MSRLSRLFGLPSLRPFCPAWFSVLLAVALLGGGCESGEHYQGQKVRINYRDADIDSGDWIKIDTIKFEHIGSRGEATKIRYPLPSRKVKATRTKKDTLYRDYNPRAIPIYMSEHIGRINKKLESGRRYKMENKALLMYSGVITLTKNDSSAISVTTSEGYGAKITTE